MCFWLRLWGGWGGVGVLVQPSSRHVHTPPTMLTARHADRRPDSDGSAPGRAREEGCLFALEAPALEHTLQAPEAGALRALRRAWGHRGRRGAVEPGQGAQRRVPLAGPEAPGGQGAARGPEVPGDDRPGARAGVPVSRVSQVRGEVEFDSVVADTPLVTAQRSLWPGRACPLPCTALEVPLQKTPPSSQGAKAGPARPGRRATQGSPWGRLRSAGWRPTREPSRPEPGLFVVSLPSTLQGPRGLGFWLLAETPACAAHRGRGKRRKRACWGSGRRSRAHGTVSSGAGSAEPGRGVPSPQRCSCG